MTPLEAVLVESLILAERRAERWSVHLETTADPRLRAAYEQARNEAWVDSARARAALRGLDSAPAGAEEAA